MKIFRHHSDVPDAYRRAVVALGNFDGVHLGHQALIGRARELAEERNSPLGVIAFEPHPQEFFHPGGECFRLTPFRTKARLIAELGVDAMFALAFDAAMSRRSAEDFVAEVLVTGLGLGSVVVGPDFRFGKSRAGDVTLLENMGKRAGFGVEIFDAVNAPGGGKISSTRIRDALEAGKPDEAAKLLGRFWSVESRVEHGDGRGRTIGVPTANMRLDGYLKPAFGVYAVRATVMENDRPVATYDGVANFGIRPMFLTPTPILETWLFDFDGDLYGKHLSVEFVAYLRAEANFDTLDDLKVQIEKDSASAKAALAKR